MNCRPGDMAVVVRIEFPEDTEMLGKIVRVVKLLPRQPNMDPNLWEIEAPFKFIDDGQVTWVAIIADSLLQPIRGDTVDASKATGRELPAAVARSAAIG